MEKGGWGEKITDRKKIAGQDCWRKKYKKREIDVEKERQKEKDESKVNELNGRKR